MYQRNLFSFHRRFSQISSSISTDTSIEFFTNTKEDLISKLASVLKSCSTPNPDPQVIQQGQQIHAQIIVNGINHVGLLGSRLLGMYILCGKFIDANTIFHQLDLFYASPWNWMIRGFTMMGCFNHAILVYFKMLGYGTYPDKYTFPYVIKACGHLRAIQLSKSIHQTIQTMGFETDVYVGSSLIKLYAENGCIADAQHVFDKMPQRDDVLWNVILNAYLKHEDQKHVLLLFNQMRSSSNVQPGSVTYSCVLSACASDTNIKLGTQIHALLTKCGFVSDPQVFNTLIGVYTKCQRLCDARELFDSIQEPDSVTWNVIIGGHVQNGLMEEASNLFREMIFIGTKPDTVTLASFLPSMSDSIAIHHGKEIHCYIFRHNIHFDVFLKNALIDMYFKCREVNTARNVFGYNPAIDIVICTAMISGYVLNGMNLDALETFRWLLDNQMRPNAVTISSILPACAGLVSVKLGKELHGQIVKTGVDRCHVGTSIIDMYAKCGRVDLAHEVFVRMSERDTVCWNSMITGFCQNGDPEKAIELFREMDLKYDSVTVSAVLSACANIPLLSLGKAIHGVMTRGTLKTDLYAESALIDMYAKCGNLECARTVFDIMETKSEVSWNSIISAYGNHGRLEECLSLFHRMKEFGFHPDHVTFLAILSACDHSGLVDDGFRYFKSMAEDYGITPRKEHYACIIDLFGRAGRLSEAYETVKSMPFDPDVGVWGTLLGACRVHGNVELAEMASRHLFEMDPTNSGYYVLLSNVQADAGKWEGVCKTRSLMKDRGVEKVPGYSWIEVNNETHVFGAADKGNPQSDEIYMLLKNLLLVLKDEGYVATLKKHHKLVEI